MIEIGKIAFRIEGEFWNAYCTFPSIMDDPILLASIRIVIIVEDPVRKKAFMEIIKSSMDEILSEIMDEKLDWITQPAPEHERGGHA